MANIVSEIKRTALRGEQFYHKICTVDKVDAEARTIDCTPIDGTANLVGVRLQAVGKQADGLVVFPVEKSEVLVGYLDRNNAVVFLCSAIETVSIKIGETTLEMTGDGIIINGGELGAMVKIEELQANLDSLKTFVEAMHSALPSAFNAVGASTAASGALGKTAYDGAMAGKTIEFEDMADEKITH